ncbi:hypothetical protein HLB23_11845 [Nocardia uniformis]|uniref:Uncharacterized protein n=1 Tax=Nocardia uniformis TaxID=53432 RepID=A0A849C2K5_9NOCA|nr:hypothetical protein [Nocardia uniformis]NNH70545.1 hypothetical protein [Nocardia uniformis]
MRHGFAPDLTLDRIGSQPAAFHTSLTLAVLGAAIVVLVAALVGSRTLAWLGVLTGLAGLAALSWRLNAQFDQQLRDYYRHLFTRAWGLYLLGGGLVVALLALLAPRERLPR